jgi:hypothetical protein
MIRGHGRSVVAFAVALLLALAVAHSATAVADVPTAESVARGECVAPELPPGEVTPPDSAGIAPVEETQLEDDRSPAPTPVPEGVPADAETIARYTAAEQNFMICANAGNYEAAAALFTQTGLEIFFGSANPYDAAANLAGYPRMELQTVDDVEVLPDGRIRGDITYTVGTQLVGDVEYWVDQHGVLLLDDFAPSPRPLQAPAGASVVDLAMIDYAFVLGEYSVPAAEAIVFRTSIDSVSESDHVATLIGCPEGTTAEQLITGEVDYATACPDSYGQQYLRPGQDRVDMILMDLEPGVYFFICDVSTPAGHVHRALGMVAQITIV